MTIKIVTKITGDKEVMEKIKILAKKNVDALKGVMNQSTLVIERRAKKIVPVDTHRLQTSITSEVKKEGNGYMGRVGTNVKYAPKVEFTNKPYLFPAFKQSTRDIIKFLERAIKGIKP